jgi:hypothetical protein
MPVSLTPEEYTSRKRDILTRCLRFTEDIYNSLNAVDTLNELLTKREDLISGLKELEDSASDELREACPKSELNSLDSLLQIILDLNEKTSGGMLKLQSETLESLKSNTQKRKSAQYETASRPSSGRLMDKKE